MMKLKFRLILAAVIFMSGGAQAADMLVTNNHCAIAGQSQLLNIESNASLTSEVVRLMDESIAVADSVAWINSGKPAFIWASEAKAACGKAYGYLKSDYRDDDYINKCECFHARMIEYMY